MVIGLSIVVASVATKFINPVIFSALAYGVSVIFLVVLIRAARNKIHVRKLFTKYRNGFSQIVIFSVALNPMAFRP